MMDGQYTLGAPFGYAACLTAMVVTLTCSVALFFPVWATIADLAAGPIGVLFGNNILCLPLTSALLITEVPFPSLTVWNDLQIGAAVIAFYVYADIVGVAVTLHILGLCGGSTLKVAEKPLRSFYFMKLPFNRLVTGCTIYNNASLRLLSIVLEPNAVTLLTAKVMLLLSYLVSRFAKHNVTRFTVNGLHNKTSYRYVGVLSRAHHGSLEGMCSITQLNCVGVL